MTSWQSMKTQSTLPQVGSQWLRLKDCLDTLVLSTLAEDRTDHDPVGLVHAFDEPADIEVAGLVASLLAFGNITVIRRNVALVLERLGRPSEGVHRPLRSLSASLRGFRHRIYKGTDVARLLHSAGRLIDEHGSLDAAMSSFSGDPRARLARFASALRGSSPSRGLSHLVASPEKGSACKRMWLYLRRMVWISVFGNHSRRVNS